MSKPCEYCGVDLPLGVDKKTRRVRSFHFASCEKRPQTTPPLPDLKTQRDALLEALQALYDEQQGPPLIRHQAAWEAAMEKARAAIKAVEEEA